MDAINSDSTIANMIDYMDPTSAGRFRVCETRMRSIMDAAVFWKTRSSYGEVEPPVEPYHKSVGLREIVTRTSFKEWRCVSCSSVSTIPIHPFYNVVVCRSCCSRKLPYRVMGEKEASRKYFLKAEDLKDVSKIEKCRNVFRVLEAQVKALSEGKLGRDVLASRLERRQERAEKIHLNRSSAYNKRYHLLRKYTIASLRRSRVRVDSFLIDPIVLMELAGFHNVYDIIIKDVLDFRVSTRISVKEASDNLFDFACFLSHCRRQDVLEEDYKTPCLHHHDFQPGIVFMNHCDGGFHFYDHVSEYARSIESLVDRSKRVLSYSARLKDSNTCEKRHEIASIVCAEDGVPLDFTLFDEYIRYGVGDPVMLAREYRKMCFLRSHGYDEIFDYFVNIHGMCVHRSAANAKRSTLLRCGGFPIMNSTQHPKFVNDVISG